MWWRAACAAEKYDRVLEDIFDLQEEVTRSIVGAIAPQIHAAEQNMSRRKRPGNLSAHDLAMRANANSIHALRRNDHALWQQALAEARQALAMGKKFRGFKSDRLLDSAVFQAAPGTARSIPILEAAPCQT